MSATPTPFRRGTFFVREVVERIKAALESAADPITAVLALCALAFICAMAALMPRGFDVTDDAFYIFWSREPSAYAYAATLFGYMLKPLFELTGQNIAAFRVAGVVIPCVLSALTWHIWQDRGAVGTRPRRLWMYVLAAALPLFYYAYWMPTPSYNWLVLVAGLLLLTSLGLLFQERHAWASAIAGLAGVVAFLAKPPTGVLFAFIYLAAVALSARTLRPFLTFTIWAGAWAAGFLIIFFALFAPLDTVQAQIQTFIEFFLVGGYVQSFDESRLFAFLTKFDGLLVELSLAAFCLSVLSHLKPDQRYLRKGAIVVLSLAALLGLGLVWREELGPWCGTFLTAFAFQLFCLLLLTSRKKPDLRLFAMLSLAALIPWAATAGTGRYFPMNATFYGGILAFIILKAARSTASSKAAYPVVSLSLLGLLAVVLSSAAAEPYRLAAPIWQQNVPLSVGPQLGTLYVDRRTYSFISTLQDKARLAGLVSGTPILDLTGSDPGVVLALGGKPPRIPWILGGYDFSLPLLEMVINGMTPEERRRAWLLWDEPPSTFPLDTLRHLGIDPSKNYQVVAALPHPYPWAGEHLSLYLLKPLD